MRLILKHGIHIFIWLLIIFEEVVITIIIIILLGYATNTKNIRVADAIAEKLYITKLEGNY